MKIQYFYLCYFFFIISCNKNEPPINDVSYYWGEVVALKNGEQWRASPYAFFNANFNRKDIVNLTFHHLDKSNIVRESCSLYKIPLKVGTYAVFDTPINKIDTLSGGNYFYSDADVLSGSYNILTSDSLSFVTISYIDTVSKEIKGDFNLIFIFANKPYANAPDTIRLTNGKFNTKIIQ